MNQDKPSQTALFISKVMFLNSQRNPQHLVPATLEISKKHLQEPQFPTLLKTFLTTKWGQSILAMIERLVLPGFTAHVQRRKWWIFNYAKTWGQAHPNAQLVIIGAGLDGLALEMSRQNGFQNIIEVDHPATQKAKKDLIPNAKFEFVPLDLTVKSIKDLKPLLRDAPVLLVWEGVSMYLKESDVQKFLKDLAQLLPAKSELVWTYMIPDHKKQIRFHTGAGFIAWVLAFLKEPFIWGVPSNQLAKFVNDCGWNLKADLATSEVDIPTLNPCRGEKIAVLRR